MNTNDIRRVIDASLGGLALTPEQRGELLSGALRDTKNITPPPLEIRSLDRSRGADRVADDGDGQIPLF